MERDDHLQRHLEHCDEHCRRLKAEGKWPWSDSLIPDPDDKIEKTPPEFSPDNLPEETAAAFRELVSVLRSLHRRLSDDGYELVDGQYRPRQDTAYEDQSRPRHPNSESDQTR